MSDFYEWLMQRIDAAVTNLEQSRQIAPGSFGEGYDNGFRDALVTVMEHWNDLGTPTSGQSAAGGEFTP